MIDVEKFEAEMKELGVEVVDDIYTATSRKKVIAVNKHTYYNYYRDGSNTGFVYRFPHHSPKEELEIFML